MRIILTLDEPSDRDTAAFIHANSVLDEPLMAEIKMALGALAAMGEIGSVATFSFIINVHNDQDPEVEHEKPQKMPIMNNPRLS
jgi:hypothetical protein